MQATNSINNYKGVSRCFWLEGPVKKLGEYLKAYYHAVLHNWQIQFQMNLTSPLSLMKMGRLSNASLTFEEIFCIENVVIYSKHVN